MYICNKVYLKVNISSLFLKGFPIQQENLLLDSMFEIPGSDIVSVHITAEAVKGESPPIFVRGQPVPSEDDQEEEQVLAQAK